VGFTQDGHESSKQARRAAGCIDGEDGQAERAAGEPDQATVGASARYSSEAVGD